MLWVGTSWKMNGTLAWSRDYAVRLAAVVREERFPGVQPFVIPSATALSTVRTAIDADSRVLLGIQNAHWAKSGPWTGEISVPQAADAGATLVEIGHSERRAHFGETDETVNLKVSATLRQGLRPILCVGESAEVFARGASDDFVLAQVDAALAGIDDIGPTLIAYEPVWAIGDEGREPEPEDVAGVFAALSDAYGDQVTALLYGGSVNLQNAPRLLAVPGVCGLFVGRSAWNVESYLALLRIAAAAR